MEGKKPWYKSMTLQGQVVQLLVALSVMFHFEFSSEVLSIVTQGIFAAAGIIMVVYGRMRAKHVIK